MNGQTTHLTGAGHRLRQRRAMWTLPALLLAGCGGGDSGGGDSAGSVDVADDDVVDADPFCAERSEFRFALGDGSVSVLAASQAPFADATSIVARTFSASTGQLLDETEAPVGQGGVLTLPAPAERARLVIEGQNEDGDTVAAGETFVSAAASSWAVPVSIRPGYWTEFDRESCADTAWTARFGHTVTVLDDGRILIVGGAVAPSEPRILPDSELGELFASLHLFDPGTGQVQEVGALIDPVAHHTATLLDDGRVFIAGGLSRNGGALLPTSSAWIIDPSDGFAVDPAPFPLVSPRAHHAAVWAPDAGGVFILGGNLGGGGAELWTQDGSISVVAGQNRSFHTLTYVPALQTAVAVGGVLPGGEVAASFEMFDLSTKPSSAGVFGLPTGGQRLMHQAAWLPSAKRLYVMGGFRSAAFTEPTSSILYWELTTQAFVSDSVALSSPRGAGTAMVLPAEDTIFYVGGLGPDGPSLVSDAVVVQTLPPPASGMQTIVASAQPLPAPAWGAAAGLSGATWRLFAPTGAIWAYAP